MRYEVAIKMVLHHQLALEADSPFEAQLKAMTAVAEREAERLELQVDVERGNG